MDEELSPDLRAVSDAVLRITGQLDVRATLRAILDETAALVQARYAALGIPDGQGGFAEFLTFGMSDALWDAIGPLPRTHGLLGAMLSETRPYRTPDIEDDSRFEGWPAHHPHMRSFLGVPILSRGRVVAAFYLTDRIGADHFSLRDQRIVETLSPHAATAIENARLYEEARELTVAAERNRLARDLHDAVVQQLFGATLTAQAAESSFEADPASARRHVRRVREIVQEAVEELRSIVFALRPADLRSDGLVPTLRKHLDTVGRVYSASLEFRVDGERAVDESVEVELFRVAQEAVSNAVRHAGAMHVRVELRFTDGQVVLRVADDGTGFDPQQPVSGHGHLGLESMRERAATVGGTVTVEARPGQGTTVTARVPG